MKISIVVPVYNAEKYLSECIDSVISQTADNWELILINDGSTDSSGKICDAYAEKHVDKIFAFHKENEGQFLTRKYGIMKCTGDYVGFLDADDLLESDYIETLSQSAEAFDCPDTVCFGFVQFGSKDEKETKISDSAVCFKTIEERKNIYKMIISGNMNGSLCSKLFKREIITANIPDDTIVCSKRFAEDAYHSFYVLAKSSSILLLPNILYRYRNNVQGFSQGFDSRDPDYFNSKYLYELLEANLPLMGIDDKETREILYNRNFNETVYFMLKYLRAAETKERKKEIIDFDWSAYLLGSTLEHTKTSSNCNQTYLKVWNAFRQKKYSEIAFREKFKKIIGW